MIKGNPSRELILPADQAKQRLQQMTRRSLLASGAAIVLGGGFYEWLTKSAEEKDLPWPQRRVLDFNGRLARAYLSEHGQMPIFPKSAVGGVKANGDIGLGGPISSADWKVNVQMGEGGAVKQVSLADIRDMTRTDLVTRFCCVEGWSGVADWTGTKFADFTRAVFPNQERFPKYVYMATPDEEYYVGLDTKSAMHPQTLLVYEQSGKPLEVRRGAPLRLAIPVKYGIKNIKRIGTIRYTDTRPDDYWADEAYDWFAGL